MKRTSLKRSSPLARGKGLNRQSKKRKKLYEEEYLPLRQQFLEEHPVCQRCAKAPSMDVHHKRGRIGKNMLDTSTWAALCRICHSEVEAHPKESREQGWLIGRFNVKENL